MTCKLHHMMQILGFFFYYYGWIYNLHDYSTYKVIINIFFVVNMKICRILWFTIRSYDQWSHLPSTILHRISILTTLLEPHVWIKGERIWEEQERWPYNLLNFKYISATFPSTLQSLPSISFCSKLNQTYYTQILHFFSSQISH